MARLRQSWPLRTFGPQGRRLFGTCALLALAASTLWAQGVPGAAAPTFSLPSDFAALPGTSQYARNAQQRTVAGLLRGFEAVAGAEVVISGPEPTPAVNVVLKPRPGHPLAASLLDSLSRLILGAVPGLTPERLQITATTGQTLYAAGQVEAPALPAGSTSAYLPWLLGLAVLAAAAVAWPYLRRRSRPAAAAVSGGGLEFLDSLDNDSLMRLLAAERPGLIGVLYALAGEHTARRLRRFARRRGLVLKAPDRELDPAVVQAVTAALRRKAERLGRTAGE